MEGPYLVAPTVYQCTPLHVFDQWNLNVIYITIFSLSVYNVMGGDCLL